MKIDKRDNTTIVKQTKNELAIFLDNLENSFHEFEGLNLIVDITASKDITLNDFDQFKELSKVQKKQKKSLVVVAEGVDFHNVPEFLTVVPSLLEAHDIIEMEEIERDLGF
ncbi:ribonuclease Z [Flavobacterium sp. U410]|jgi:hypothetical protein